MTTPILEKLEQDSTVKVQTMINTPTLSYLDEKGSLSKKCKHKIDDKTLIRGYKAMLVNQLLDERMFTLQRQGTISFSMPCYGEEACSVASAAALEDCDWLYPQYREVGALLYRGFSIEDFVHGMFCNKKDLIHGRQMPNHFGSKKHNVVTVSSPIATQLPHAAGCAYAMKIQKEQSVSLAYFGDGASSEGDFHAALNFASVYKAPCIFFCRNNGYAISTSLASQFNSNGIYPKGAAYGMTAFKIDGNDFFAIHETVQKARKLCLEGKGPILIEAMTYRLGPHSTSDDPSQYRENAETEKWKEKSPIKRLKLFLTKKKVWDDAKEESLRNEIKKEIDKAIEEARRTDSPSLDTLFKDVYFEIPASLQKQYDDLKIHFPEA